MDNNDAFDGGGDGAGGGEEFVVWSWQAELVVVVELAVVSHGVVELGSRRWWWLWRWW